MISLFAGGRSLVSLRPTVVAIASLTARKLGGLKVVGQVSGDCLLVPFQPDARHVRYMQLAPPNTRRDIRSAKSPPSNTLDFAYMKQARSRAMWTRHFRVHGSSHKTRAVAPG